MKLIVIVIFLAVALAAIFLLLTPANVRVAPYAPAAAGQPKNKTLNLPPLPEAPTSSAPVVLAGNSGDIGPQQQLPNPPAAAKGIYLTGWSAGYAPKINSVIGLIGRTELNAVVIDIKDYSGYVSYRIDNPEVLSAGAESQIKIIQPNALIKKLHDAGIYVIGRITAFQDPVLAKAHPEWALKNKASGKTWTDNKGLAWMDPAAEPVWNYNLAIARDALARGFDEVNFDYMRFASDGDLGNIGYPFWDEKTPRHVIIGNFFKFLRENMPNAKLSVDLFGLSTVNRDDLGIGQVIEDAYKYFDYVSPMVYPSHYAAGFIGYQNPAKYPYEVIKYSLDRALDRLATGTSTSAETTTSSAISHPPQVYMAKLRPWLQDFDLGAIYDAAMVRKETQATYDVLFNGSGTDKFGGWLLWDPANIYTEGALETKK